MPGEHKAMPGECCKVTVLPGLSPHDLYRSHQLPFTATPLSRPDLSWQVPGLAARWDSEATVSLRLHFPSFNPQSNLTSSSNTLCVAWQRQYQHRNSCIGMETAALAWQPGCRWRGKNVRQIPPLALAVSLVPIAVQLSCLPWVPPMNCTTGSASLAPSFPRCLLLHEMSCWFSAQLSQVLAPRE